MIIEYLKGMMIFDFNDVDIPVFKKPEKVVAYMQDLIFSMGNESISLMPNWYKLERVGNRIYKVPVVARAINTSVVRNLSLVMGTFILGASSYDRFKILKNKKENDLNILEIRDFFKSHKSLPHKASITITGCVYREGDRMDVFPFENTISLFIKGNTSVPNRDMEGIFVNNVSTGEAVSGQDLDLKENLLEIHNIMTLCIGFYVDKYTFSAPLDLFNIKTLENFNLLVPRIDTFPQLVLKRIIATYPDIITNLKKIYAKKIESILNELDKSYTVNMKSLTNNILSEINDLIKIISSLENSNPIFKSKMDALKMILENTENQLGRFIYGYNNSDIEFLTEAFKNNLNTLKNNSYPFTIKENTLKIYDKFLIKSDELYNNLLDLTGVLKIWKEFKLLKPMIETDKVFLKWLSDTNSYFEQDWFIHQCLYHILNYNKS